MMLKNTAYKKVQNNFGQSFLSQLTRYLVIMAYLVVGFFSPVTLASEQLSDEHKKWLKDQFGLQHEKLIPVVAVADMFYACNIERKVDPIDYQVENLVETMDKNTLAEKLALCLGDDEIKSEVALNFGLIGCFDEQLDDLPSEDKKQKMVLVKKAILSLSRVERQKSFTKCVNAQAIPYLK